MFSNFLLSRDVKICFTGAAPVPRNYSRSSASSVYLTCATRRTYFIIRVIFHHLGRIVAMLERLKFSKGVFPSNSAMLHTRASNLSGLFSAPGTHSQS